MIKSLGIKIGILLVLFTLTFSTVAQADGGPSFRLLLVDVTNGTQRVITDNASWGGLFNKGNLDGNAATGTVSFGGQVGNFFATIYATSSEAADGGGILTLSANIAETKGTSEQFAVVLEDVYGGDSDGANATLENTIQGYNYSSNTVTATAVLTNVANFSVQSWLDPTGAVPNMGGNTAQVPLTVGDNLATLLPTPVPPGVYNNNLAPANATSGSYDLNGVTSSTGPALTAGQACTSPCTSIYSASVLQFTNASSGGTASFTLTVDEIPTPGPSVPEPTSLVLLGSALLGLGVLSSRKKILNIHGPKAVD